MVGWDIFGMLISRYRGFLLIGIWNILEINCELLFQELPPIEFAKHGVGLFAELGITVEIDSGAKRINGIWIFAVAPTFRLHPLATCFDIQSHHSRMLVKFLQSFLS
mgnify:CR=1 FL=1